MSMYEVIISVIAALTLIFKVCTYVKDRKNNRP